MELQNRFDERLYIVGKVASQLVAAPDHGLFNFIGGFSFEGSTSVKHLVEQHSKSPDVDSVVVF